MKVLTTGRLPDTVLADIETAHTVTLNNEDRPMPRQQILRQVEGQDGLLELDNVVVLPHAGSATIETRTKMARIAADNLLAGLSGQKPPNCLNWDTLCDKRPP